VFNQVKLKVQDNLSSDSHVILKTSHDHCRQRVPIENVWSTCGIF